MFVICSCFFASRLSIMFELSRDAARLHFTMQEVLSTLAMRGFILDLWRSPHVSCVDFLVLLLGKNAASCIHVDLPWKRHLGSIWGQVLYFGLIAMAGSGETVDSLARPCQSFIAAFGETPKLREVAWIDLFFTIALYPK